MLPNAIAQVLAAHIGLTQLGVQEMHARSSAEAQAGGNASVKAGDTCLDYSLATPVSARSEFTRRAARSAAPTASASVRG